MPVLLPNEGILFFSNQSPFLVISNVSRQGFTILPLSLPFSSVLLALSKKDGARLERPI